MTKFETEKNGKKVVESIDTSGSVHTKIYKSKPPISEERLRAWLAFSPSLIQKLAIIEAFQRANREWEEEQKSEVK